VLQAMRHARLEIDLVHDRRIRAAEVDDHHPLVLLSDDGVIARHQGVAKHQVIVRAAANGELGAAEVVAASDLRSALGDQEG
jgi:hypothetical protein